MGFIGGKEFLIAAAHPHNPRAVARKEVELLDLASLDILVGDGHGLIDQTLIHKRGLGLTLSQGIGKLLSFSLGHQHAQDIAAVQLWVIARHVDIAAAADGSDDEMIREFLAQLSIGNIAGDLNRSRAENLFRRVVLVLLRRPTMPQDECNEEDGHGHTNRIGQGIPHGRQLLAGLLLGHGQRSCRRRRTGKYTSHRQR